ncbi:AraC family transcriptional regulator [Alistipes sp. OttesenSCG-928-B03]|nr:AraC family transcriptional regulator [Alistipes sp. OttesenSCG-928-B03]
MLAVHLNDPYIVILSLSAITVFVAGLYLLLYSVPRDPELRNYRISRRFLACAYIALASSDLWFVLRGSDSGDERLILTITLTAASLQAFLFTFAMITLVNIRFIAHRRMVLYSTLTLAYCTSLLTTFFILPGRHFHTIFLCAIILYIVQLGCYVVLFLREYRAYKRRIDDFFSDDESRRLKWVLRVFFMAAGIGVVTIASLFTDTFTYMIFTTTYTVFYIWFAARYIGYVAVFHHIKPAFEGIVPCDSDLRYSSRSSMEELLATWTEQKGYLKPGVTLDSLARCVRSNRTYVSSHINSVMGMSFCQWVSKLRIDEAARLIDANPQLSLSEVSESVGISSRGSFNRQFKNVRGVTPGRYRQSAVERQRA